MNRKKPGFVRIIGGRWRGRRLPVADLPGLRPSGDRGRETLFNWLQAEIRGARCADLFAGTGALGLEAASRGAAQVVLLERAARAARALEAAAEQLSVEADLLRVVNGDALDWLRQCAPGSIDIAFVDPPFGSDLADHAIRLLDEGGCMAPGGLVYLESSRQSPAPNAPPGWRLRREKSLGEVRMQLFECLTAPAREDSAESAG